MQLLKNKNLITMLVAVLALVVLVYIVYPALCDMMRPKVAPSAAPEAETEEAPAAPVAPVATEADVNGEANEGFRGVREQFESETELVPEAAPAEVNGGVPEVGAPVPEASPEASPEAAKDGSYPSGPYVDSQTGSLVDGPGFEKGEVDDIYREPSSSIPSNYYFLDDGSGGEMSIQHNLCSRSCCSEQWPTPFKRKYDPYVCRNKDKFVPSRIMCNNTFQDSGCLCLTKNQAQFLYNRGGNGREWF